MTYKHDLSSSEVLRSLEKVAHQKGMLKNDPLVRTAAKKTVAVSLIPSDSLLDNVIKLCAELHDRGFHKQAEDVENNLVIYKQAQTMYGVSGEEGKDLIEFAHPEGSHKLEGVDAHDDGAVVEYILDQMAKAIQMVEKKPTGKLSESQKAIQAIKVILGAAPLDLDSLYAQAQDALEKFRSVATSISDKMGEGTDYDSAYFQSIYQTLTQRKVHAVGQSYGSHPFSQVLLDVINDIKSGLEPSYLNPLDWGGPSAWNPQRQQAWQEVRKYFPLLKKYADRFRAIVSQIESQEAGAAAREDDKSVREMDPERNTQPIIDKLNGLIKQLSGYLPRISKYQSAVNYIDSETQEINDLIAKINQQGATPELNNAVATVEKDINDFVISWKLSAA